MFNISACSWNTIRNFAFFWWILLLYSWILVVVKQINLPSLLFFLDFVFFLAKSRIYIRLNIQIIMNILQLGQWRNFGYFLDSSPVLRSHLTSLFADTNPNFCSSTVACSHLMKRIFHKMSAFLPPLWWRQCEGMRGRTETFRFGDLIRERAAQFSPPCS